MTRKNLCDVRGQRSRRNGDCVVKVEGPFGEKNSKIRDFENSDTTRYLATLRTLSAVSFTLHRATDIRLSNLAYNGRYVNGLFVVGN